MPGSSRCLDPRQQQDCSPLGFWEPPQSCVDQTCVDDHCQGDCAPEQVRCQGEAAQRCDNMGQWATQDLCNGPGQYCENGECRQCSPWAKQFGTLERDSAESIVLDTLNHVYITGITDGALPGSSGSKGNTDAFVLKYSPEGKSYWTHHLGSNDWDFSTSIAFDVSRYVYVAGHTGGALPDGGGSAGLRDAFLTQFTPNGNLQWTRQFGTSERDSVEGIAVDPSGYIYVTGLTEGPLSDGGDPAPRSEDVFVAKYNPEGKIQWTKQFGSNLPDVATGVAVNSTGQVYIVGHTNGTLPENDGSAGSNDAFVVQYNVNGELQWTKQFGSNESDSVTGIALGSSGHVYVTGNTGGVLQGGGRSSAQNDAFVMKYNSAGDLLWAKQFGSSKDDSALGIALDASDHVYVAGNTGGVLQGGGGSVGQDDVFVMKFSPTGAVQWTKQLGSKDWDNITSIAVDAAGRSVYIAGFTDGIWPNGGGSIGGIDAFAQHLCF